MNARPYRSTQRDAALEATRMRIIEATVALHARHGVLATSYAMIAQQADVAVPTVYNHFPERGALVLACTAHVSAQSPPLGPEIFADLPDLEARLRALVGALFAYYRYRAPWLRWGIAEAAQVPELAGLLARAAAGRRVLIGLALAPLFGSRPPPALVALCDILLDFPAWRRLADAEPGDAPEEEPLVAALLVLARARAGDGVAGAMPREDATGMEQD